MWREGRLEGAQATLSHTAGPDSARQLHRGPHLSQQTNEDTSHRQRSSSLRTALPAGPAPGQSRAEVGWPGAAGPQWTLSTPAGEGRAEEEDQRGCRAGAGALAVLQQRSLGCSQLAPGALRPRCPPRGLPPEIRCPDAGLPLTWGAGGGPGLHSSSCQSCRPPSRRGSPGHGALGVLHGRGGHLNSARGKGG